MIKTENLSQEDQLIIAEYVYSYIQDILIRNDLEKVVKVLKEKKIEIKNEKDIHEVFVVISEKIEKNSLKEIMKNYYRGTL